MYVCTVRTCVFVKASVVPTASRGRPQGQRWRASGGISRPLAHPCSALVSAVTYAPLSSLLGSLLPVHPATPNPLAPPPARMYVLYIRTYTRQRAPRCRRRRRHRQRRRTTPPARSTRPRERTGPTRRFAAPQGGAAVPNRHPGRAGGRPPVQMPGQCVSTHMAGKYIENTKGQHAVHATLPPPPSHPPSPAHHPPERVPIPARGLRQGCGRKKPSCRNTPPRGGGWEGGDASKGGHPQEKRGKGGLREKPQDSSAAAACRQLSPRAAAARHHGRHLRRRRHRRWHRRRRHRMLPSATPSAAIGGPHARRASGTRRGGCPRWVAGMATVAVAALETQR